MREIHPELRKKASSPELRRHDGCDDDAKLLIEQMNKEDQNVINEMLEKNYQRGFQHGIAAVREFVQSFNVGCLSPSMIEELITAAGSMRDIDINGVAYSYDNYMSVLDETVCVEALLKGEGF